MKIHLARALARAALATVLLQIVPSAVEAQGPASPRQPVILVVPFTPGSGGDIIARLIAPELAEKWSRPVIVDNRAGASGNIGAGYVAKAAPDGNTMLLAINTLTMVPSLYKAAPFDIFKDFKPVAKLAVSSFGLAVNPTVPATDVAGLIEVAKSQPGKLNYASPGNGTPHHLAMELLKLGSGTDISHVPYKGLGGATTDLLGGHVQVMLSALPSLMPQVNGGKLRLLAVTGSHRSPLAPSTPTFREQGIAYMDGVDAWFAIFVPAKTPNDIASTLERDITAAIGQPAIKRQLESQGITVDSDTSGDLEALIRADYARWKKVISDANISAD